jgi:hypothetical protein
LHNEKEGGSRRIRNLRQGDGKWRRYVEGRIERRGLKAAQRRQEVSTDKGEN